VLQTLQDENLLENDRARGESMMHALAEAFGQHPHVGDIRGRGLLIGLELVADRDSKATFDPNSMVWNSIQAAGMQQGLLCYPGFGTADGVNGDHILLAPPFIIDDRHVDEIVGKLVRAVDDGIREATR
jgi:adenosylmethionine-8-amino-7-oxononanoate aminotransferase